jgi:simple sugar transport system permease protein/ribose transport system permease protein
MSDDVVLPHRVAVRPAGSRLALRILALAVLAAIVVVAVTTERFLTWDNAKAILNSASLVGIMALGLTFVTLVGSMVSLAVSPTAVIAAMAFLATLDVGIVPALVVAIAVGAAVTALQGALVGAWNANPVILTIGAAFLINGFADKANGGQIVRPAGGGYASLNAVPLGIPVAVYVMIAVALVLQLVLTRTVLGRQILLVGDNREAARAAGVPITRVVTVAFALAGAALGLGGAFLGAFNMGASTFLEGTLTFDVIAAVLVGGTSIAGGYGSPLRTMAGALAVAAITDLLLLRGLGTGPQIAVKGVLVAAVVIATQVRLNRRAA